MEYITKTSDDEKEEEEMRQEWQKRWAPSGTKWDLVPAIPREGPKIYRPRTEILEVYSDPEFREMFRFDKLTFLQISYIIMDNFPTGRNAIDPEKRLGIFLSFVGGNEFQSKTGHLTGVKKGSVCSIMEEVAKALVARYKKYIKWLQPEEIRALADENNVKYGLPDLPLEVDGPLIRLVRKPRKKECPPKTDSDNFISRKGFPALNIQVTCDTHHLIRDISVKWCGTTHDGRVYRNSKAKKLIERQSIFALAANSAYPTSRMVVKS